MPSFLQRHRQSVIAAVALLVIAAVVVVIVYATRGSGNLQLTVVNEDNAPLEEATIQMSRAEGVTNSSGKWEGLAPAGSPTLLVTAATGVADPPAYQPFEGDIEVVKDGRSDAKVVLAGYSSLTPWDSLWTAIQNLDDGDASVEITYSFIPAGVAVSNRPPGSSVELRDHVDGSLSSANFKAEIAAAFAQWAATFQAAFSVGSGYPHNLTVSFRETVESSSPPLFGPYSDRVGGTGDFRIGMWSMEGDSQVLASAYGPNNAPSNAAGDILFNASIDWRLDSDVSDGGGNGGYSVKYVAVHEIGHALGFGHHALPGSVMTPTAGRHLQFSAKFPDGLAASQYEHTAARGIYGSD